MLTEFFKFKISIFLNAKFYLFKQDNLKKKENTFIIVLLTLIDLLTHFINLKINFFNFIFLKKLTKSIPDKNQIQENMVK